MRRLGVGLILLISFSMATRIAAQQISPVADLERVRTLYVAAAYAEALAAIPAPDGVTRTDLEQYRALCLLALGREAEAVTAVERMVRDHPTFLPPATDTTPRMLAIFGTARAKLVPDVAKRAYVDAKASYEKKDRAAAHDGFQKTLELIDSLPEAEKTALADLRLLASEFLDLTASARPDAPTTARSTPAENGSVGTDGSAKPSPPAAPAGAYAPPVAIKEQLPPWNPPDTAARRSEYVGLLRVQISAQGKVESATMVKRTHPTYDVAALRAAKSWIYQPATRGGEPVAAQKDIQVRLLPR
ncbi:MAG: TonB family protein [Vicinamibacterales bacterium]